MSRYPDAREVRAHAIDHLEEICAQLAPGGRTAGGLYTPLNPTRHDRRPGSFVITVAGPKRGSFVEYAAGDREKGDVIDLVSYLLSHGAADFKSRSRRGDALRWLTRFTGLERMTDTERSATLERADRQRQDAEREANLLAGKRSKAWQIWLNGSPVYAGTPVDLYLRGRGIELAAIANREDDIRYVRSQEYWPDRVKDPATGRTVTPGPSLPAMAALMRGHRGQAQAVHLTFLDADGAGGFRKATVDKAKLIWPDFKGAVIRLTRGDSGLSCDEAAGAGLLEPVALSEGIEDGLSIAMAAPALRVWACAALGNIANAPALPFVDQWLVHRQNDTGYTAVKAFDDVVKRLEDTGRPVAEIASHYGKDLNDQLRGAAHG